MTKSFAILSLLLSVVAVVCVLIGVVTKYWFKMTISGQTISHYGLWEMCIADGCTKIETDYLKAVRAMEILTMLFIVTELIILTIHILKDVREGGIIRNSIVATSVSAFILSLIGIIVFVAKTHDSIVNKENISRNYGYSFILTAVCCGLMFCNTVVLAVGIFRGSASYESI